MNREIITCFGFGIIVAVLVTFTAVPSCTPQQEAAVAHAAEDGLVQVARDLCEEGSTQPADEALIAIDCIVADVGAALEPADSGMGPSTAAQVTTDAGPPRRMRVVLNRAAWQALP